jgi:hypothetical protein
MSNETCWSIKRWFCGFNEYVSRCICPNKLDLIDQDRTYIKYNKDTMETEITTDCYCIMHTSLMYNGVECVDCIFNNPIGSILCMPFALGIHMICLPFCMVCCMRGDIRPDTDRMTKEERIEHKKNKVYSPIVPITKWLPNYRRLDGTVSLRGLDDQGRTIMYT